MFIVALYLGYYNHNFCSEKLCYFSENLEDAQEKFKERILSMDNAKLYKYCFFLSFSGNRKII